LISQAIVPRFIDIVVDEFLNVSIKLKDAAIAYKSKHFEDRSFFNQYTATMVSVVNLKFMILINFLDCVGQQYDYLR
jgi:hypothetical protein